MTTRMHPDDVGPGQIWHDPTTARWLVVDRIVVPPSDGNAGMVACTLIRQRINGRVIKPRRCSNQLWIQQLFNAWHLVDSAPDVSPPLIGEIVIHRDRQVIVVDGHEIPYDSSASGPQVYAARYVRVTLSADTVREIVGGAR